MDFSRVPVGNYGSNFLKVYPGYFDSHMTPVHECKVQVSVSFIVYVVLWQSQEYIDCMGKYGWWRKGI